MQESTSVFPPVLSVSTLINSRPEGTFRAPPFLIPICHLPPA